ncbi:MAG: rhodanese-like domain-containing protein [Alphaproteobacteria bacterium]|jgi:rhodanese-related sulfurtransferase|nr:rhodanese-like domain-containing protein [Alphaproteobacteria bacterium]MBT5161303.1 rhodanese-like domain-containing protein [Alphaproteobacteria bacterium]MBT5917346.1 rhodanese-like domain-containing protein [Alphaproteobacteria bacterium]MBT6387567.1 rhodanese-like domain-containing protein [Alphaproteobacteria bacterium]
MTIVQNVDPKTAADWIEAGDAILIDVREAGEHAAERIANAELIPLSAFRIDAVPQDKRVVVHCAGGKRAAQAVGFLQISGHKDVHNMVGGIMGWKKAGLATVA